MESVCAHARARVCVCGFKEPFHAKRSLPTKLSTHLHPLPSGFASHMTHMRACLSSLSVHALTRVRRTDKRHHNEANPSCFLSISAPFLRPFISTLLTCRSRPTLLLLSMIGLTQRAWKRLHACLRQWSLFFMFQTPFSPLLLLKLANISFPYCSPISWINVRIPVLSRRFSGAVHEEWQECIDMGRLPYI